MSSVDDRIVNMQFNNKQFTQGVTESQRSLQGLEQTLAKTGGSKGLESMGASVDQATKGFGAMRIAGISAIATIASKATSAGLQIVKGMTLDPITQGFAEYQKLLNSTQTIMANTGKSVQVVNKYLGDLNRYSDQTIYNFGQMADSIGKFTAAGVPLKAATSSIKGLANTAALSGSSVEQLNTAMYQMSQALSTGTIRLMDWNSLANAGMGGANVREALMATNRTLGDNGAAMDAAIAKFGSFRDSLQAGWLSADTFNKTMKVMAGQELKTGKNAGSAAEQLKKMGYSHAEAQKIIKGGQATFAYSVKQLKEMGYSEEAAKKLNKLSQASIESATKIKTFSQLLDVVKESIGSGWSKIFMDLFGNFKEASKLWTAVGTSITGTVSNIFGSVDKVLMGWKKLGGYQDLWQGIGNIFKSIGNILAPFVAAFKAIMPATGQAGSGLAKLTQGFYNFSVWLEKVTSGASVLTPVLVAIFGGFKKVAGIVGAVLQGLAPLGQIFSQVASSAGNLAAQGAQIASDLINGILSGLNPGAIQAQVSAFAMSIVDAIKGALGIHSPASTMVPVGQNIVQGIVQGLVAAVPLVINAIGFLVSSLFQAIGSLFKGVSADELGSLLNVALTGAFLITLNKIGGLIKNFTGIGASIRGTFDQVTDTLKTMQHELRAKMLMEIAISVGILTASLIALSMLDPKKMASGLAGVSVMLADVVGVLFAMSKIEKGDKGFNMATLAASLFIISAAMIQLGAAVTIFAQLSVGELAKGIGGLAAALGIMVGALLGLSKIPPGAVQGLAGSIFVLSSAMVVLSAAVLAFGNMQIDTLVKGLGAMAVALALLVGAMLGLGKMKGQAEGAAASILIMSAAMVVLSAAVLAFGNMDLKTLALGFGAIGIALALFVAATLALSANVGGTLAAAASIGIMAAAMASMVPVIAILGSMNLEQLAKGIGAFAIVMGIFVAAMAALGVVAYVTGPALVILGAGLALIGVGMLSFATGFALLAATGTAGIAVMTAAIEAFIMLLPTIAQQLALAFIAFMKVIANATGPLRDAFGKIFTNMLGIISDNIPKIVALVVKFIGELLKGIVKLIPQFGKLISQMITTGLNVLRRAVPQMVNAGLDILQGILTGIKKRIGGIVTTATDIVVNFLNAIGKNAPRVADAGFKMIISFINGLTKAINKNAPALRTAGLNLAMAIVNGMTGGLLSRGIEMVRNAAQSIANSLPGWMKKVLGISSPSKVMVPVGEAVGAGVAKGIGKSHKHVIQSIEDMANAIIAEGDKQVLKAARAATNAQKKAYYLLAKADLAADRARDAAAYARKHKKDKQAQKNAKNLQKDADRQKKTADRAQAQADRAKQHVEDVKTFQAATSVEKGDIKDAAAVSLADKAEKMLAKANAEAARGRELLKTNRKAGEAMLAQSRRDAKEADKLEKRAREAHAAAQRYYAQDIKDRIKALEDDAAYEAADAAGKAEILKKRQKADEDRAKRLRAEAAKFLAEAKKYAKTDAKRARKALDRAEAAAQAAQEAADQARQEGEDAASVVGGDSSTGGTGTSGATITPSKSILEDAARAIDRYTASLQQAEAYAAATPTVVQFTQNNTSPESLSTAEIYRQSKNLLSAAATVLP